MKKMNKYKFILGSALLVITTAFGINGVVAQDSEEAELEAQMQERRAKFAQQYPNIAAALEDGRINRAMLGDRLRSERGQGSRRGRPGNGGFGDNERRAAAEARREERQAKFFEENPELATEIKAFRTAREQARAEFSECNIIIRTDNLEEAREALEELEAIPGCRSPGQ